MKRNLILHCLTVALAAGAVYGGEEHGRPIAPRLRVDQKELDTSRLKYGDILDFTLSGMKLDWHWPCYQEGHALLRSNESMALKKQEPHCCFSKPPDGPLGNERITRFGPRLIRTTFLGYYQEESKQSFLLEVEGKFEIGCYSFGDSGRAGKTLERVFGRALHLSRVTNLFTGGDRCGE